MWREAGPRGGGDGVQWTGGPTGALGVLATLWEVEGGVMGGQLRGKPPVGPTPTTRGGSQLWVAVHYAKAFFSSPL